MECASCGSGNPGGAKFCRACGKPIACENSEGASDRGTGPQGSVLPRVLADEVMHTYSIYEHKVLGRRAIKNGFSWPAFFFGIFWMISKSLWTYAGVCLLIVLVLSFVLPLTLVGNFIIAIVIGSQGNVWYGEHLTSEGFVKLGTVRASGVETAIEFSNSTPLVDDQGQ